MRRSSELRRVGWRGSDRLPERVDEAPDERRVVGVGDGARLEEVAKVVERRRREGGEAGEERGKRDAGFFDAQFVDEEDELRPAEVGEEAAGDAVQEVLEGKSAAFGVEVVEDEAILARFGIVLLESVHFGLDGEVS